MFRRMTPGRVAAGPWVFHTGRYTSVFYPFRRATSRTDWTMRDLRSIGCKGARGGTGIHGRTVVYITMHAWFSKRGQYIAREVRHLYNQGCYVRILYSFMGFGEYKMLKAHTGPRMQIRRVLFAGPLKLHATKYSHMKMVAVSGVVGGDPRSRVVWTGSNNWSLKSLHADEVTLEIRSSVVYNRYVSHWRFMERRRSSATYANYSEPTGGGRAPG
jgi:phosphatidylserine/phosphatidylglycerophosphate/cardiolipin synthase-like enzyme